MTRNKMIYLDNAATSWQKPQSVFREVRNFLLNKGGNPGRGLHKLSLAAAETVYECRERIAEMFNGQPENVVFTLNTTYALNTAIKGLLLDGGHAICSDMEHNSVWRPLEKLKNDGIADYSVFETGCGRGEVSKKLICTSIADKIRPETKAVICNHASNICSAVMPVAEIGALCRKKGIPFIVDAAQSAGRIPINIEKMNIDILCAPGHKGLFGLSGVGFMLFRDGFDIPTFIEGGNGVNSLEPEMSDYLPERLEAGTLPTAAIAGLSQGIAEIQNIGINNVSEHEKSLFVYARKNLSENPRVKIYLPDVPGSILLFNIEGIPSDRVAAMLDQSDICVRAGFHCAALAHKTLQTPETGAVRASFGIMNTRSDINALVCAVNEICKN